MNLPKWCQTHSLLDFMKLIEDTEDVHNQEGKTMNEHTDTAFQPMDKVPANVGLQSDGSVRYQVVEGDTFVDGKLVKPEVVGYVQIDQPENAEAAEVRD